MSNFNIIFKDLRLNKSITQATIAEYLNVTPRTIRFYESGERKPDFDGLISLATYFDVSLDYLVGRTDNPKINK